MAKATIIPYFNAKVVSIGVQYHLHFSNQRMLQQYLAPLVNKHVKISIQKIKKHRSNNQNSYYWGVVVSMIAEYTGMTIDETHEALKNRFLRQKKAVRRGDRLIWEVDTVRSTASLATGEFEQYLADVRLFAGSDLGLNIPLPNEVDV